MKHGHSKRSGNSKEYRTWAQMKYRCKKDPYYAQIKICDSWLNSFELFLKDMGTAPTSKHSLERVNNSLGYSPSNCRWATQKEQMNNVSRNRILLYKGTKFTLSEASDTFKIPYKTLQKRLEYGWGIEQAIERPAIKKPRRAITQSLRGQSLSVI